MSLYIYKIESIESNIRKQTLDPRISNPRSTLSNCNDNSSLSTDKALQFLLKGEYQRLSRVIYAHIEGSLHL